MGSNKPIHKLKEQGVSAAIWANKTKQGDTRHCVTFSRVYYTADQPRDSTSFGRSDLVSLVKLAQDAHAYLIRTEEQRAE
ncbi:MAG: hypothetical protein K2Y37_01355 [Pirellulales bacterium]|nr:hypothetical protein [Pirellulales bacterium]